ncbi:MAG: ATP-binding protein [Ignavibacterium sp.]|nr:ATP-binding protein [Ignavibacterium sp.]MCX7611650.1 ATP-binding protein [Ignavibacterium sp.]MDW8374471.1 putative DNA binding domain-containing protein [Ignavibacteriales bacterium]
MNHRELKELIEEGENLQCEFKLRFTTEEKIAKEMIAFANTKGGYLIFGIDDDREIVGVESEKEVAELVYSTAKNYCVPPLDIEIHFVALKGRELVIVEIPESDNKPHRLQDYLDDLDLNKSIVTIRVNDKSVQASKEMIRILKAQSSNKALIKYTIGPNEKIVFEYLKHKEKITVKELSKLVNISERRASRTLVKMVRANLLMIHTKENGEEFFTAAM